METEKQLLEMLSMEILADQTDLTFDGGYDDNRLFDEMMNTYSSNMTEDQYNKMRKDLETFEVKGNGFTVSAWNDSSGYHYWNVIMQEDNYIQITVYIDNLDCCAEEIKSAVQKVRNHFDQYERTFY